MKTHPLVIISKILAALNIFLAAVVVLTCYVNMKEYYEFLKPKEMASANHLQIIGVLFVYAIISIINSLLFLFNKKLGWWLTVITIGAVIFANILSSLTKGINIPMSIRTGNQMAVNIFVFYTLLLIINFSKPVRKHFKIIK